MRSVVGGVRALLKSPRAEDIRQAFELLEALDDPKVVRAFAVGISIDESGGLVLSPAARNRSFLRDRRTRELVALGLLRLSGGLDQVEVIDLGQVLWMTDLSPLVGLPALRSLALIGGWRAPLVDLSPLSGLPALESLALHRFGMLRDLSALVAIPTLRELDLLDCSGLEDLSPLAALPALERLNLTGCRGLPKAKRRAWRSRRGVVKAVG